MRELEFLPAWYPQLRRRSRVVRIKGWVLLGCIIGLGVWFAFTQRSVWAAEVQLRQVRGMLAQSVTEEQLLDEQLKLRKELQAQEQLVTSLGYPVEMSRLLQTIDATMPKEMSLSEFDCAIDATVSKPAAANKSGATQSPRRLNVRAAGVAPSDVDLANFLTGLTNVPFFDNVSLTYSRSRHDGEHLLREFEVTFSMDLNLPAEQ